MKLLKAFQYNRAILLCLVLNIKLCLYKEAMVLLKMKKQSNTGKSSSVTHRAEQVEKVY